MSYQAKLFFISAALFAIMTGIGMSVLVSLMPQVYLLYYSRYRIILPLASIGAAAVLSFFSWLINKSERTQMKKLSGEVQSLYKALHNLEEAADRREEFIASFAHELKTPLTAIIGYADMLRSKDMAPKPRFTAAGYIFSEGRRLEALSLKLMDIIVAGKGEFERRRYDAGYFIREVAAVSVPSTGGDGLVLDMRWEKGEVLIEPDLFKTLLINLVDNARKASKSGQHVELYGKREEGGYSFYVKDYGRGIQESELSKIKDAFYMVDKSRSRSQNGAGLGLALCQRIAELHGTSLEYDSTVGKGTTVRVFLAGGESS